MEAIFLTVLFITFTSHANSGGWIGFYVTKDNMTITLLASIHAWPQDTSGFPDVDWPFSRKNMPNALLVESDVRAAGQYSVDRWLIAEDRTKKALRLFRKNTKQHVLKSIKTPEFRLNRNLQKQLLGSHPLKIYQLLSCDGAFDQKNSYKSLDFELITKAANINIPIFALESFEEQVEWLSGGELFNWNKALSSLVRY
jgi:hypothetical protein